VVKFKDYVEEHGLNEDQVEKLKKMMRVWNEELDEAVKGLSPEKRAAVSMFLFNTHHDRGIPQVPSSYAQLGTLEAVPLELYTALKVSKQKLAFKNPVENLKFAQSWLKEFWAERSPQEQAVWALRNPPSRKASIHEFARAPSRPTLDL
jgi:hypothetical protein